MRHTEASARSGCCAPRFCPTSVAAADEVWLAAKLSARGKGRESDARYRNLCRRLGFGMLAVTDSGDVEVIVKPPDTAPRRNPKKRSRLND